MSGKANRLKIQINAAKTRELLEGKAVAFKVQPSTAVVEIRLTHNLRSPSVAGSTAAEMLDVFFNGRKAR